MVRDDRHITAQQAEAVLALAAQRQGSRRGVETRRQPDRRWRHATRTAQHLGLAGKHAQHRIVDTPGHVAVMQQEIVGDRGQLLQRLPVVDLLRLAGQVAAGQHDRMIRVLQDQMVQRRVGQHETQRAQPRGETIGQRWRIGSPCQQHDRSRGAGQQVFLLGADGAIPAHLVHVAGHQRERLVFAVFARAQPLDGRRIGGVAGELESAQALDRDDGAALQQSACGLQHVLRTERRWRHIRTVGGDEPCPGAAAGAGDRLGMETAVDRIVVFGAAGRAQGEGAHRRAGAIVGNAQHDGQARSAVGAVGEGVAVAALRRVEHLRDTGYATGGVRRHTGVCATLSAGQDRETGVKRQRLGVLPINTLDACQRRRLLPQTVHERRQSVIGAADMDQHPQSVVADRAAQIQELRQPPDRGPKSDALHQAFDADTQRTFDPAGDRNRGHRHGS